MRSDTPKAGHGDEIGEGGERQCDREKKRVGGVCKRERKRKDICCESNPMVCAEAHSIHGFLTFFFSLHTTTHARLEIRFLSLGVWAEKWMEKEQDDPKDV